MKTIQTKLEEHKTDLIKMPIRWFNVDLKLGVPSLTLMEEDWLKAVVPDKSTNMELLLELSKEIPKDMINLG